MKQLLWSCLCVCVFISVYVDASSFDYVCISLCWFFKIFYTIKHHCAEICRVYKYKCRRGTENPEGLSDADIFKRLKTANRSTHFNGHIVLYGVLCACNNKWRPMNRRGGAETDSINSISTLRLATVCVPVYVRACVNILMRSRLDACTTMPLTFIFSNQGINNNFTVARHIMAFISCSRT